jgi:hypothetical protein
MSEQILTPNSTGGGIPTPVTKTNIFKKKVGFPDFWA